MRVTPEALTQNKWRSVQWPHTLCRSMGMVGQLDGNATWVQTKAYHRKKLCATLTKICSLHKLTHQYIFLQLQNLPEMVQ